MKTKRSTQIAFLLIALALLLATLACGGDDSDTPPEPLCHDLTCVLRTIIDTNGSGDIGDELVEGATTASENMQP